MKNRRVESNLSKITRPVTAIKSRRFALLCAIVAGGRAVGERYYQCDHGNSDHNNEY